MSVSGLQALIESDKRLAAASRLQNASDVNLPQLKFWNYQPCRKHRRWTDDQGRIKQNVPKPGCRECGLYPRKHQRVGALWLYLRGRALLADSCGTGKTAHFGLLVALMQETGELANGRVILVCRSAAVLQHLAEIRRMLPMAKVVSATGTKRTRMQTYVSGWDVMVIGQHMFLRDVDALMNFDVALLAVDDVDALRNRSSKTAWAIKRMARRSPRCVVMTGTPLQKKLHELYSVLEPLGGREVFGSEASFMRRYVRTENMVVWTKGGRRMTIPKVVGYKNVRECSELLQPFALRRTAADIDDVDLPAISTSDVYLELYPAQRARYEELKQGVVRIIEEEGAKVKQANALSKIHYGSKICAGLAALGEPDTENTSVKLDWVMDKIGVDGDLGEEKVVVFMGYKQDQPLDAQVLTPDRGFIAMGDIQMGDAVVDPEGSESYVTGVYPQGVNDVYRITFDDGTTAESTLSHLWKYRSGRGPRSPQTSSYESDRDGWVVGSLQSLMDQQQRDIPAKGHSKYRPHVPLVWEPPEFPEADLPLDPYLLGLLLGDGNLRGLTPMFCSADSFLIQECARSLPEGMELRLQSKKGVLEQYRLVGREDVQVVDCVGPRTAHVGGPRTRGLCRSCYSSERRAGRLGNYPPVLRSRRGNKVRVALELLGLAGLKSRDKFVPEMYLRASSATRLAVLQGLMDTDGDESGVFSTTSPHLRDAVAWLARSLGASASVREYQNQFGPHWHVYIRADFEVARLPRKHYRRFQSGRHRVKRVASVEFSRSVETQCISVSAPSHLYVTDDWTVTHNSITAFQDRMDKAGIGYVTIWGNEPDKVKRQQDIDRFWNDPGCRVLVGTQAIEQSLNLQCARHLINVDMILNPARMEQLAGRIRRDGSAFSTVYVHNLLTLDTQEERYIPLLEREQALIDTVWDENSELFESLTPLALLTLISG